MKEPHEYQRYLARLRRPAVWLLPRRMWGKWVRVGGWTEYEREWLVSKFEERFWPVEARGAALSANFEIMGRDSEDDDWEVVSDWRRAELRQAEDVATALHERGAIAGQTEKGRSGRRPGSGIDTLVRHLKDREQIERLEDVYAILRDASVPWIEEIVGAWDAAWRDRIEDAFDRGRKTHKKHCRYCAPGAIPPGVAEAVARFKTPLNG